MKPSRASRGSRTGRPGGWRGRRPFYALVLAGAGALLLPGASAQLPDKPRKKLELSGTVRPWEFLPVTGTRAGLLGTESGRMEAWVYPLKIFREFHLTFHTEGRLLPAEALARTVLVRPESATILYAGDNFQVQETFLVPVREQGAVIVIDVETEQPLEIEAGFRRDFQLEWPAALGATYLEWDSEHGRFRFGEERKKFAALVGSPTAGDHRTEFQTNYAEAEESSLKLGVSAKGKDRKLIVIAGSLEGEAGAEKTYRHLAEDYEALWRESAESYRHYLDRTVGLELPDEPLQTAYDWARVSLLQGLVTNPTLGTGLVAGYRTSGQSQRPGFAWYFGRDSEWSSLALNAMGDFETARTALEFIGKFQREDGKIPHEISQGASFVDWFKDYPYPYASADATPLYLIAMSDYVRQSGDARFAAESWPRLEKAYQFLKSTYGPEGLPQNFGFGHGWVEGGPLLPVKTEFYQSALGAVAIKALSRLALSAGQTERSEALREEYDLQESRVKQSFWIEPQHRFAFALDRDGQRVDTPSVLATVAMWFGLPDQNQAGAMIEQLAASDHQTDWGMRILSSQSPQFGGGGYHYGSVWPLFTGWAAVGEYRYHRAAPAYQNLRANALLALDGSLGHVTEVLSGDYYQPLSTSSPHQIWSSAMVVSPILKGLVGLESSAVHRSVTLAPHLPATWPGFSLHNVAVGESRVEFTYSRSAEGIRLETHVSGGRKECVVDFSPAVSLRARVVRVELDGRPIPFRLEANSEDAHVSVHFTAGPGADDLRIHLVNDFGFSVKSGLPVLGSSSRGLRVLSETWSEARDQLTLELSGEASQSYQLELRNPGEIVGVEGAEFHPGPAAGTIDLPSAGGQARGYLPRRVVIHFSAPGKRK